MSDVGWARIQEVFTVAVQLSPEDQRGYLARACAGEPELRCEVEAMLAADDASGFMRTGEGLSRAVDILSPLRVGPFRITGVLGRGGMGVVYRGRRDHDAIDVAIKTTEVVEPMLVQSIRREIRGLVRLEHPGIVRILDEGMHEGAPWYAMTLCEGTSLSSAELTRQDVLDVCLRLCDALAYLHGEGLVHGDLKPSNILVSADNVPVIVDFGLSTRFGGRLDLCALDLGNGPIGTAAYMAPEQIRGEPLDARADLYAFGCILYRLLGGSPPFDGETASVLRSHLEEDPPLLDDAAGPLIQRLLAKDQRGRLGYAADVARVLEKLGAVPAASKSPATRSYLYRAALSGRAAVVEVLGNTVREATAGRGGLRFIAGPSGIGKSRLALDVAAAALAQGCRRIVAECLPERSKIPLHAWREPLNSIVVQCRRGGRALADQVLGELGPVLCPYVPAIINVPGQCDRGPAPELSPREARERVIAAVVELLARFARDSPLFILVDDLQWADALSLDVVAALAEHAGRSALACLCTFRSDEANAALRELSFGRRIDLSRLDTDSVRVMIGDMLSLDDPPAPLVELVFSHAEGNPFYVDEYLRAAVDTGVLRRETGRWRVVEATLSLPTPTGLRALVGQRLAALPASSRAALEVASVLGRVGRFSVLSSMCDSDTSTDELRARGILAVAGHDRYRLSHDALREVAYERTDAHRRRILHALAAEELSRQRGDDAEIAGHFAAAGQRSAAARHYLSAARDAVSRYAGPDAHRLYQSAIELAEGRERAAAMNEMARDVLMLGGEHQRARAVLAESLALARRICDRPAEADALRFNAATLLISGELGAARRHFESAAEILRDLDCPGLLATVSQSLALVDRDEGRLAESLARLSRDVIPIQRRLGDKAAVARALLHVAFIAWRLEDLELAEERARESLSMHRATAHRRWEGIAQCVLGQVLASRGALGEARTELGQALLIHREVGDVMYEIESGFSLAGIERRSGRLERAASLVDAAETLCRASGTDRDLILVLCERARLELARGRAASDSVAEARALVNTLGFAEGSRHADELNAIAATEIAEIER